MAKPAFHAYRKNYSSCFSQTDFANPPAPTCAELRVGSHGEPASFKRRKIAVEYFMSVKYVPPTQRSLFLNALSLNRIQIWWKKRADPALEKYLEILSNIPTQSVQLIIENRAKLSVFGFRTLSLWNYQSESVATRDLWRLFCLLSPWRGRWDGSQGNPLVLTPPEVPTGGLFYAWWRSSRVKCFYMLDNMSIRTKNGLYYHSLVYTASYGTEVWVNLMAIVKRWKI